MTTPVPPPSRRKVLPPPAQPRPRSQPNPVFRGDGPDVGFAICCLALAVFVLLALSLAVVLP